MPDIGRVPHRTRPNGNRKTPEIQASRPLLGRHGEASQLTLDQLVEGAFDPRPDNPLATTLALVVAVDGEIVAERYGPDTDADTTLISWSMAKSVTSALCGLLVADGCLDLDEPATVAEWGGPGDDRSEITVRQLLQMRSGLRWNEDYVDESVSDVITMLFGAGKGDTARFAAGQPLAYRPGTEFLYSSGTTNLVARIVGNLIGGGAAGIRAFAKERLFEPLGMNSATMKCDNAGTFVGSSFLYATARDYLRFGELFRNDGLVDGVRLLPEGWVTASTAEYSVDPDSGLGYGLHWWIVRDEPRSFAANGYEGQRIQVCPDRNLTFVRLGKTPAARKDALAGLYRDLVEAVAS